MEFLPDDTKDYDYSLKVSIAGECDTGKSKFLKRIINFHDINKFKKDFENYCPTFRFRFYSPYIKFKNKIFNLLIWDTTGQVLYRIF